MKKIVALLLCAAMSFSLVACGSSSTESSSASSDAASSTSESSDEGETSKAATGDYKVAMICDSSINDGGWGAACYNAMVTAAEKMGWSYEVTDSISQDAYYDSIVAYCSLGYNMIYAPGNQYTDAVLQAADEYPDVSFALLNGAEDTPAKATNSNVSSLLPNAEQIGWIAGALAGLMTESGKIAFIGGMELDTTKGKIAGFEEAAKYVAEQEGKTVELLNVPYANSFSDAPKGKEFATELISQGADVFFGDASAVDSGAREAIDDANAASGSVTIYDIAQPADILGQNECIICSQVTDNSAMIVASMEAIEAGTFGGETLYGTLQNGTLSAGALSDLVPTEVQEKYQTYLDQMMDETFMQ
jgi:basic membrane protein A and related proteins